MTEYLYDRENPKSHFRQKLTGIEGLFYGVPNINERADMIGRYFSHQFNYWIIEPSLKKPTVISPSLFLTQRSQEMKPKNGEPSRTSLASLKIQLATPIGNLTLSMNRIESDLCGSASFSTYINRSCFTWWWRTRKKRWLNIGATDSAKPTTNTNLLRKIVVSQSIERRTTCATQTSIRSDVTRDLAWFILIGGVETKTSANTSKCARRTTSDPHSLDSTTKKSTTMLQSKTQALPLCATPKQQNEIASI